MIIFCFAYGVLVVNGKVYEINDVDGLYEKVSGGIIVGHCICGVVARAL